MLLRRENQGIHRYVFFMMTSLNSYNQRSCFAILYNEKDCIRGHGLLGDSTAPVNHFP